MKEDLEDINCHQYTRAAEEDKKELTVKNFFKFGQGGLVTQTSVNCDVDKVIIPLSLRNNVMFQEVN